MSRICLGLCRGIVRWLELTGQWHVYAETGVLPAADRRDPGDGRGADPGAAYVMNGIREVERFVAMHSQRP